MPDELLSTDPNAAEMVSNDPNAATIGEAPKAEPSQAKVGTAISMALAAHILPYVHHAIEEFATNPNVPKAGSSVGRFIGGVAPVVGGAAEGGPVGMLAGVAAASKGAWAGGKTGWFTAKLAQSVAKHVASLAETVDPYIALLLKQGTGAIGIGELAQLAEPDRADIGVAGVGKSVTNDQLIERLRKQLADPKIDKDPQRRAGLVKAINDLKGKK